MSVIRIQDIEKIRFAAPDLGKMRHFLLDFGLRDLGPQADGVLRMRAMGSAPVVHETEQGPPGFRAMVFRANSIVDLETLAAHDRVAIQAAPGPGAGWLVRLTDPDGFGVEVVAGLMDAAPLALEPAQLWNTGMHRPRDSSAKRIAAGPSNVLRLGHAVFIVSDLQRSWDWYAERFGLIISDDVRTPDGKSASMFIRCNRGDAAVDHHTLNFAMVPGKTAQFHHAAFEVADLDDLMAGHDRLKQEGYRHAWGVGRHFLGSQVFDYWLDPFGNRIEHWTDGDFFFSEDADLDYRPPNDARPSMGPIHAGRFRLRLNCAKPEQKRCWALAIKGRSSDEASGQCRQWLHPPLALDRP